MSRKRYGALVVALVTPVLAFVAFVVAQVEASDLPGAPRGDSWLEWSPVVAGLLLAVGGVVLLGCAVGAIWSRALRYVVAVGWAVLLLLTFGAVPAWWARDGFPAGAWWLGLLTLAVAAAPLVVWVSTGGLRPDAAPPVTASRAATSP